MIIPCIDLMEGKVVQLVQGREKALEAESVDAMLEKFAAFPADPGHRSGCGHERGSNDALIAHHRVESGRENRRRRPNARPRSGADGARRASGHRRHRGFY